MNLRFKVPLTLVLPRFVLKLSENWLSSYINFDDATNYYGEQDRADAFDDEGLSTRYFDQE